MFENYFLIAIIISAAWIGLIVYYMVISGRQRALEEELNTLQLQLDQLEQAEGKDSEDRGA